MRKLVSAAGLLAIGIASWGLAAGPATAQVQVDVRLEKPRYLAGEPIVVLVDVRNVGDEAVSSSFISCGVRLDVAGVQRRVLPNICGCFCSFGGVECGGGSGDRLQPGHTRTYRYLLKAYDLMAGKYELTASGKVGLSWYGRPDPVPGGQFDRTLSLNVVASTENDLRTAFGPLVSDSGATEPERRRPARAAIIESAPPFLESLIASFVSDDEFAGSAIVALGRMPTQSSRTFLKNLYRDRRGLLGSGIVLALARIGSPADVGFFGAVLHDATADQNSRRYAALALGYVGGEEAAQQLARAVPVAPAEVLPSVATALGNTRSRAAVPILIGLWGPDSRRNEICGALRTLTHQHWCDGTAVDSAATRRQWLRRWNETGANAEIFGPDTCPADPVAAEIVSPELTPGLWRLVVDANGRRSAPVSVEITEALEMELTRVSPPRPHPAQGVFLSAKTPAQVDDYVQLTDARGTQWRIRAGVSSLGINLMLPDEVADGEASVRLGRSQNGVERFSAPLRFLVTSGPLPLKTLAAEWMTPVAPGQWTDLGKDHEIEFELRRADRIEVEFRQGNVALISQTSGRDRVHVQVPARLAPGLVTVRTRTWIEQTASEWSAPTTSLVLERPAPPWVTAIELGQIRSLAWWVGKVPPAFVASRPGQALVLRGHFPVAGAADLRVQLIGTRETLDLPATDVDGGVRVEVPVRAAPGDWRLVVGTKDATTSPQEVTTVRVR